METTSMGYIGYILGCIAIMENTMDITIIGYIGLLG